jgi:tetratricopeptide (TPR) repeat protein
MRIRLNRFSTLRAYALGAACALALGVCASYALAAPMALPAATAATPGAPTGSLAPSDLTDIQGWLDYRTAHDLPALPAHATNLYRMGVEAQQKGDTETAVRLWRGAEELDPGYLAPRLTLVSHFLSRDPSQALMEIGRLAGLARSSFRLQHFLTSFFLFYALTALFLATLGVALVLCWRHRNRLRHVYGELLARRLPAPRARLWGWILVALPFALGLGVAVPAAFMLALLWSYLKKTERLVFVALSAMLVLSPLVTGMFDDLSLPVRSMQPPFYSTLDLDQQGYSPEGLAKVSALAAAHPDNPFLAFAEGWLSQRAHRYDEAVASYERAQTRWPDEARIANNLGNIEFARGNAPQAEVHYKRAIELAPRWAPAHYNLGQLHTARFRYAEASEEIAQATALDFDLVRNLQARSSGQATPALAEEWIEPRTQWQALFDGTDHAADHAVVPPAWQPWFESRGTPVAIWALIFVALGLALGLVLHHHLPARVCGNCASTVCRRCATRRKDQVLCEECASLLTTATTPEFGRLLLFKRRRETRRRQGHIRTAIAVLVPGYGVMAFDRLLLGWFLAVSAVASALVLLAGHAPFPYDPRVIANGPHPLAGIAVVAFALTYCLSLLAYLSLHGHAREEDAGIDTSSGRARERLKRAA